MNKRHPVALLAAMLMMAVMFIVQPVAAQNHWLRAADETSVSLDFFKASFDHGEGLNFFTSMAVLSAYVEASDNIAIVFDLPTSNVDSDFDDETLIGNPYIGMELKSGGSDADQIAVGRLGIRPPIASEDKFLATLLGVYTMYDRFEALGPDLLTIYGGGGYQYLTPNDLKLCVDLNGALMVPTEGDADAELFLDYNFTFWFVPPRANIGIGFAGRMILTEGDLSLGERTVNQLGVFANYDFGNFEPGFHLRIPVDADLQDTINLTYGINLTFTFERM